MRILIVEDEIKIRKGMANLIVKHTQHTVAGEAKNGVEGLEMVKRYCPDLVISDIRMPVMDGLEMIRAIREQELCAHCIILSGYSEFEYARQALQYGVDDYLIKPLAPEDVIAVLERVQEKMAKELRLQMGEPEKRLKDALLAGESEEISGEELELVCGFGAGAGYRMLAAYTGKISQEERKLCRDRFERLQQKYQERRFYFFFLDSEQEFICITQDYGWQELERELQKELQKRLLNNTQSHLGWVWAQAPFTELSEIGRVHRSLKAMFPYGLVLGTEGFLEQDRIQAFEPEEYRYPKVMEQRLKSIIWGNHPEEVLQTGQEFIREMAGQKTDPMRLKEGYNKMVNFLLGLMQEGEKRVYEQLLKLQPVQAVSLAVTEGELQDIIETVFQTLVSGMNRKEDIGNYTINRAIRYIRNHYQESISLEQVADSLDITPEYLSTLFNREMGENFSVFLKKFRISHAKRLLKGTDKKVYEIAQEVGYGDPKYFNRVFKEEEGVTPGDFRGLQ